MKFYLLLALSLLLLGCSLPGGSPPSATPSPEPTPSPLPAPQPTPLPTPQPPPAVTKPENQYLVSAAVLQFDQQLRYQDKRAYVADKRQPVINYDNITKSYGIAVEISDVSAGSGTNKALKNPEKAVVKLVGPNGKETLLKQNAVSQADYDLMPNLFKWVFITSDTPDPIKSRYAAFELNTKEKLKGVYKLVVDIEGDGKIDGERSITIPGLSITKPLYGSKEFIDGFDIEWSQAGSPDDFIYDLSVNDPIYYDEQLSDTSVFIEPNMFDEDAITIEPGMYTVDINVLTGGEGIIDKDAQDYFMRGISDKKIIFQSVSAKETNLLHFKVGDFCHCDDLFEPKGSCSVDELDADQLC